jgi:hypothetical protein
MVKNALYIVIVETEGVINASTGKVHLTPLNYHPNDNVPPKLSIAITYSPNYKSNYDNVPQILNKMTKLPLLK